MVEGRYGGMASHVQVAIAISPVIEDFPGIALITPYVGIDAGILALRGREILGQNGNVYTIPTSSADPTLTGRSKPGDATRGAYLSSVWSSPVDDGAPTDTISGSIIACDLNINIPHDATLTGTYLGVIDTTTTLYGTNGAAPTLYKLAGITLSGSEVLTIDTTGGPVIIEMINTNTPGQRFELYDEAKIVNVRTDGQPPQVGDARIMIRDDLSVDLFHESQGYFILNKVLISLSPCPALRCA